MAKQLKYDHKPDSRYKLYLIMAKQLKYDHIQTLDINLQNFRPTMEPNIKSSLLSS